jgi:hypothetical protein
MAVLAASAVGGSELAATADAMVRTRERIEPRADRFGALMEQYRRFVGELEERGWLDPPLAEHARTRAGARDIG